MTILYAPLSLTKVLVISGKYRIDLAHAHTICIHNEKLDHIPSSTIIANTHNSLHTSTYCGDYAFHIQDKAYTPYSFNLQQQNASQTRTNFLMDLKLDVLTTWSTSHFGVVNVE